MASGVEIAGLVLAVLPLLISAAEHYKGGVGFVKRAAKKELFAAQYKDELVQQKTLLALYLKGVVGRTSLSADTQMKLVNEPIGATWKRPEVVKEISEELADAYQPFLDIISRLCRTFARQIMDDTGSTPADDEIIQQLQDLCLEHNQAANSSTQRNKIFDRIKFSWRSSQRAEILAELKTCNKMLDKLSNAANRAKPFARKQQSRRVHAAYEHREVMQRLFAVLRDACNCTPVEARQVGLRLQIHTDANENDPESTFEMIVFLSQGVICELSARIAKAESQPPAKKKVRLFASNITTGAQDPNSISTNMKVLQDICQELHDSPWSQSQWNSDNLTFIDNGSSGRLQSNSGIHLQLRRPYTRSQVAANSTLNVIAPQPRRNAHLHALGVVLLELYLNRSLQEDVIASGSNDYRSVAQDVLEECADEMTMTPEYLNAVRFCLSPKPDPYTMCFDFEESGFREIYYREVIAMLEENLTSRFEVSESVWLQNS